MMKRSISAFLAGMLAIAGCDSKSDKGGESTSSTEKTLKLAVIPKSTGGEFWETVERGAKQAAADLKVEIQWEGTVTETEIAEQNKIIENMITKQVDGIALAPLNQKAMRKKVQSAVDSKIPVVVFDSAVDGDAHTSFVATDNKKGGQLGGEHLAQLIGGKGKVVVLRYVQGTGSTEKRAEGCIEALKKAGIELLADPYPEDGQIEGAKKTATNTLQGYIKNNKLEVDGIFACNLYSTQGMLAALEDLRKSKIEVHAKFVGFDTSPKLVGAVKEDKIQALVAQDPYKMGYLAVDTLVKHLRGEKVDKNVDTGVALVTKEAIEKDPKIRKLVGEE